MISSKPLILKRNVSKTPPLQKKEMTFFVSILLNLSHPDEKNGESWG
jgi:hypothetical protein